MLVSGKLHDPAFIEDKFHSPFVSAQKESFSRSSWSIRWSAGVTIGR